MCLSRNWFRIEFNSFVCSTRINVLSKALRTLLVFLLLLFTHFSLWYISRGLFLIFNIKFALTTIILKQTNFYFLKIKYPDSTCKCISPTILIHEHCSKNYFNGSKRLRQNFRERSQQLKADTQNLQQKLI